MHITQLLIIVFLAVCKEFPNKLTAVFEGYASQSLPFFDKNATPVRPKFIADNKFCPLTNLVTLRKHYCSLNGKAIFRSCCDIAEIDNCEYNVVFFNHIFSSRDDILRSFMFLQYI